MNKLMLFCAFCILMSWAGSSQAILIGFDPAVTNMNVGSSFDVDVVVSDLGNNIVSAFDLDITYNSSVLAATGVTFGAQLNNGIEFFSFQTFSTDISNDPGLVDIKEVSLLPDFMLASFQSESVTLATLSFTALTEGLSYLDFDFDPLNYVVGTSASALAVDAVPGAVMVSAQAVPEPATILLFAVGILGFVLRSKKL